MTLKFAPPGITQEELDKLVSFGLKYDERMKRQMIAGSKKTEATLDDIDKFENVTGRCLPQSYRNFLLEHNGGRPSKSHVEVANRGEKIIQSFLALTSPAKLYTIGHSLEVYRNRIPGEMVPIANSPGGDLFLINTVSGHDFGKVYFWDHEQEADHELQPFFANTYPAASSIEKFLESLFDNFTLTLYSPVGHCQICRLMES